MLYTVQPQIYYTSYCLQTHIGLLDSKGSCVNMPQCNIQVKRLSVGQFDPYAFVVQDMVVFDHTKICFSSVSYADTRLKSFANLAWKARQVFLATELRFITSCAAQWCSWKEGCIISR